MKLNVSTKMYLSTNEMADVFAVSRGVIEALVKRSDCPAIEIGDGKRKLFRWPNPESIAWVHSIGQRKKAGQVTSQPVQVEEPAPIPSFEIPWTMSADGCEVPTTTIPLTVGPFGALLNFHYSAMTDANCGEVNLVTGGPVNRVTVDELGIHGTQARRAQASALKAQEAERERQELQARLAQATEEAKQAAAERARLVQESRERLRRAVDAERKHFEQEHGRPMPSLRELLAAEEELDGPAPRLQDLLSHLEQR